MWQAVPMAVLWLLLATTVCSAVVTVESAKGAPPRVLEHPQTKFKIPVGTTQFRLACPVVSPDKGQLMIEWTKNGEVINSDNARIKLQKNQRELRIKNVLLEDSGVYECLATNGFGHRTVQLSLHVQKADGVSLRDSIVLSSETSAPIWMSDTEMEAAKLAPLRIPHSSRLELRCPARGNPLPEIRWYKDNILLSKEEEPYSAVFVVENVKVPDSGDYRCVIENNLGSIENVYRVSVDQPKHEETPVIDQSYNTSVRIDHTAQLTCKVKANNAPIIKWLKQIDDVSALRRLNPNATVINNFYGMMLLVLDQPQDVMSVETVNRGGQEHVYTNRLIIPSVRSDHAGKYVCVVTSAAGNMVYKSALLDVIGDSSINATLTSDIIWYIILPILVIFMFLVTFAVLYLKCNSEDSHEKVLGSKRPPPPSIRPPVPPHQVSDPVYHQSYPSELVAADKNANSPLILRDNMFHSPGNFPLTSATLDKKHMGRLMVRDGDLHNMYDRSPPQPYWGQSNSHVYAPSSGNYRTLEIGFPFRDPKDTIYEAGTYVEQAEPFIHFPNR